MPRALDLQILIHSQVADYVAERVPLYDFIDSFMDTAEDVYETDDAALIGLVNTIKLYWAEFTHGDHTEDELRALLRPLVGSYRASYVVETIPIMGQLQAEASLSVVVETTFAYNATSHEPSEAPSETIGQGASPETLTWHEPLTMVDKTQWDTRQELAIK